MNSAQLSLLTVALSQRSRQRSSVTAPAEALALALLYVTISQGWLPLEIFPIEDWDMNNKRAKKGRRRSF